MVSSSLFFAVEFRGQQLEPQFVLLALRDVRANGDILPGAAVRGEEWIDGRIHPVVRAVFRTVFDFGFPHPAAGDGLPEVGEK